MPDNNPSTASEGTDTSGPCEGLHVPGSGWNGNGDPFLYHRHAAISALSEAVAAVYGYDIKGEIAEFGTMSGETAGGLARAIASCDRFLTQAVRLQGHPPRQLSLFDSFAGLPTTAPNSVDAGAYHVSDGLWAPGALKGISTDELASKIGAHLSAERFEIVPGWFSETVPALASTRRFALLHIDSDLYSSAMDVLDSLLSRGMIARGAYVFFDDWNCNRADPRFGERRAWADVVAKYDIMASDEGSYGIFAHRFVIHDYRGSSVDAPLEAAAEAIGAPEPQPTSTDVYDHQEASLHYNVTSAFRDLDPSFQAIYERCRPYSMTSTERLYALFKAVEYLQAAGIPGDFVECGVWRGGSMMLVAEALALFGGPERTLHLFDTFEGLPEPSGHDVDLWGNSAQAWWPSKRTSDVGSDWARSHIEEVRQNILATGIDPNRVRFIQGMVENTLPQEAPSQIALLRLDTDWYASTRHELEHLYPLLARNGVLIIDDYGHFKGAKKAVDEYFATRGLPILLNRIDYTGRLSVKTHD